MKKYKIKNIGFPPDIIDIRPWTWAGFENSVRYTFVIDFPTEDKYLDHSVRKNIKKANREGFISRKADCLSDVLLCLKETEERQSFNHLLSLVDLELAVKLIGEDSFRCYVCYAPDGKPASARVVLHKEGCRTMDWVAGTTKKHIKSGATQLNIKYVLDDIESAGATGFDFCGANIPNVASAKSDWGGKLTPFFIVEQPNFRWFVKKTLKFLKMLNY